MKPSVTQTPEWKIGTSVWQVGDSGPLHVAVLFIDLVNSTDLASLLGLEEYADVSRSLRSTCLRQCRHFFESRAAKYQHDGRHYRIEYSGDELVVHLHTDRPHDDVYQLVCLAIALKCAWLGVPVNAGRIASGRPTFELAAGIHSGPVWATRTVDGFDRTGFTINLAKRIETASRVGERFRVYVSDPAFKLVNRRVRNLIFGPRQVLDLKGVTVPVGMYELVDSFVNPARRLAPELSKAFLEVAQRALTTNSFDLWIHSCLQIIEGADREQLDADAVSLCDHVLSIDPYNAVALFYRAEAERERGRFEAARLYLEDLTRHWPALGDGWLALAQVHEQLGEEDEARRCLLQARRHGVEIEQ